MRRMSRYEGDHYSFSRTEAVRAIADGGSVRGAARLLRCSYGTMIHICRVLHIPLGGRGRPRRALERKTLARYTQGHSWAYVAGALGCSIGLVRREFKRHGLSKRDERNKRVYHPCDI